MEDRERRCTEYRKKLAKPQIFRTCIEFSGRVYPV